MCIRDSSGTGQNAGIGGRGGGGRGHNDTFHLGTYAKEHTGGGGGGCGNITSNHVSYGGGKGGSGIVLLQTNVPTPNVNTEFKLPEHSGFIKFQYDRQRSWQGPVTPDNNTKTIKNVKLPDGSIAVSYTHLTLPTILLV